MADSASRIVSDLPIHPGDVLLEELDARRMSAAKLAQALGLPTTQVQAVLAGQSEISDVMAAGLERVLGSSPDFWANLTTLYHQSLDKQRQASKIAAAD